MAALPPVYLLSNFPSLWHVWLPIPLITFCSKLDESVRMIAHVIWLSPLEAIQRKAWVTASPPLWSWRLRPCRLHCLHGWWLHLHLDNGGGSSHPCLVFGDWAISVHYQILLFAVFLNEKLDLCLQVACWPFSGRSVWQRCHNQSRYFSHSLVCLSSVSWHTCNTESSAWPIQDLPCPNLDPFEPFMTSRSGVWGFSTALKYALTHSLFCLVCIGGRSCMNLMSMGVSLVVPCTLWLALPHSALCIPQCNVMLKKQKTLNECPMHRVQK